MFKKLTTQWSAKALARQMRLGEITFDNVIQRNPCWDMNRKSLLVHTMLSDYPIPHFYATRSTGGGYDMIDGKQRSYTIRDFLNNDFALSNATPETTLDDGEAFDLVGKKFKDLPEELQERITDFPLNIYYFENISDDEVIELFFRINNGCAFIPIELTRVRAVSMKQINEAAKHKLFHTVLTANKLKKYINEDLVIKTWVILNVDKPDLSTQAIRPLMESVTFTDDEILEMYDIYDRMFAAYEILNNNKNSKNAAKKFSSSIHFLALVPVIKQSIADNVSDDDLANWIATFFGGHNGKSVSDEYNEKADSQTTNPERVQKRHNAIMGHYNSHFRQ